MSLRSKNEQLFFTIENSNNKTGITKNGIGLDNIKKRLDLLYLNNYDLKIENKNNLFIVNLKLNLN